MHRLVVLLVLLACKGGSSPGVEQKQEGRDRTTVVTTPNGDKVTLEEKKDGTTSLRDNHGASQTATPGKLPDGFPLPVYEGATVEGGIKVNDKQFVATLHTKAAPKLVTDYYAAVLAKRGFETQRTESNDGEHDASMLGGEKDRVQVMVNASRETGAAQTDVSISYGESR